MFIAALICLYGDFWNSKQKARQKKNLATELQNSNHNSTFSWSNNPALNNPAHELRF